MKSFFKKSIIVFSIIFCILFSMSLVTFALYHCDILYKISNLHLDTTKLLYTSSNLELFDNNGNPVYSKTPYEKINFQKLPKHTIDAFISIEDKNFYNHNGINYKRILKATLKNLSKMKFAEGASTISQQLIKNTHLTKDKTIKRKISEVILTKELENNLSKNEILTSYFNVIYFGNRAFGLNQASQYYFSKDVQELNIAESATLAGIIKSPATYSPISHPEKCINRRNIVLKEMYKDKKISYKQLNIALNTKLNLKLNKSFLNQNTYYNEILEECSKILNIPKQQILIDNYKITTYLDAKTQKNLEDEVETINNNKFTRNKDFLSLVIDNKTGGITAYNGRSDYDLGNAKRQPGSVFKPLISYAPALEYNIISPSTPLLDEKININGYQPKNYNNQFHGWINAKEAIANSYNIPAVKLLDYIGIEKAKKFASNFNINFNSHDKGYSLALGGLTKGIKIKDMANCYQAFANNGEYIKASFIKNIKDKNGNIIYSNSEYKKRVMKESTAFLLSSMLRESVTNGTSKKLNLPNYQICAKTGTVGISDSKTKNNSDAWNISYTPNNTVCVWVGSTDNKGLNSSITGGNIPTSIAKNIYENCNFKHENFIKPNSVVELDINEIDYNTNKTIKIADSITPDRYKIKALFAYDNLPKKTSTLFQQIDPINITLEHKNNITQVNVFAYKHLVYDIFREDNDSIIWIGQIKNKQGSTHIIDETPKNHKIYSYYTIAHYLNNDITELSGIVKSNVIQTYMA